MTAQIIQFAPKPKPPKRPEAKYDYDAIFLEIAVAWQRAWSGR